MSCFSLFISVFVSSFEVFFISRVSVKPKQQKEITMYLKGVEKTLTPLPDKHNTLMIWFMPFKNPSVTKGLILIFEAQMIEAEDMIPFHSSQWQERQINALDFWKKSSSFLTAVLSHFCFNSWYTSILILSVLLSTVVSFDPLLYLLYFVQMAITLPPHVLLITSLFCYREGIPCCLVCPFVSFPLSSLCFSLSLLTVVSGLSVICHIKVPSNCFVSSQTVSQGLSFFLEGYPGKQLFCHLRLNLRLKMEPRITAPSLPLFLLLQEKKEKHANHSKKERSWKKIEFVIRYKNK